jgi:hypothetical protein
MKQGGYSREGERSEVKVKECIASAEMKAEAKKRRVEEGWWVGEKHSGWYSAALLCSRVVWEV